MGWPKPAARPVLEHVELLLVDLAHREHHDEQHHQQRHHVGVRDQPALVVLVLLVLVVGASAPRAMSGRLWLGAAPAGSSERSFWATTRGLEPAWMAATPSMTSSIRAASSSLSRLSRLPNGSKITLADMTPHRVATNAPAIRWPSLSGCGQVLQHVHQAHDGADDADGRRVAAGVGEELRGLLVGRPLGVDLGLEDLAQLLGVGAVDGHLTPLREEVVVDALDRVLEGQQALAAGLLGEVDDGRDQLARPARPCR